MYNRYNAATGEYLRVPEPKDLPGRGREAVKAASPPPSAPAERPAPRVHTPAGHGPAPARRPGPSESPFAGLEKALGGFGGQINRRLAGLETEDLLLLAVVYLMYRESGDRQLLIVLAALLFM